MDIFSSGQNYDHKPETEAVLTKTATFEVIELIKPFMELWNLLQLLNLEVVLSSAQKSCAKHQFIVSSSTSLIPLKTKYTTETYSGLCLLQC